MKTLNQLIDVYNCYLQQGEIQAAYKGIFEFIGKLKADFIKKYPHYEVGGIYQGYMDMTYFTLSTKPMKDNGLKIALVYLHEKGSFEAWLSARNRDTAKRFKSSLDSNILGSSTVFHEDVNQDAIIERILVSSPDFENQRGLIGIIEQGVEDFETAITALL